MINQQTIGDKMCLEEWSKQARLGGNGIQPAVTGYAIASPEPTIVEMLEKVENLIQQIKRKIGK